MLKAFRVERERPAEVGKCRRNLGSDEVMPFFLVGDFDPGKEVGSVEEESCFPCGFKSQVVIQTKAFTVPAFWAVAH